MHALHLIVAAVRLLAPVDGGLVTLLPECQRAVLAKETRAERAATVDAKAKDWRASNPVVVSWAATAGEKGPWEVQLAKRADFSDARLFDFDRARDDRTAFTNELKYANLEIATTYYLKVIAHEKGGDVESAVRSFLTEDLAPRWIRIEGRVGNFRDLGGRIGLGGKRVRQGLIYRSQGLNDNSASGGRRKGRNRLFVEDVAYLTKTLGIKTDLDLRSVGETANMTTSPLGPGVRFIHHSSGAYKTVFNEGGKKVMAKNFRVFLDRANYPILFHCIGGADRTGALGYVLNGVLGVSRRELETDWESTFYPKIPDRDEKGELSWRSEQHFDDGFGAFGDANSTWNERVILYLKSCGITDAEIETFRSIMLEQAPSDALREAVAAARTQIGEGLVRGAVFARGDGGAVGVAGEAADGRPMTEATLIDLASVTKTFTAAAAALLVAEGKLDADSLHALATHTTTGRFKYDCANFVALGDAVERASGMKLDRFCRERIFRPLGMTRTTWGPVADDGTLAQMLPAGTPPGVISDLRARAAGRPVGNAGAFSDIRDMRLFVTDLLTRRTFPKAYYDLLFTCRYEEAGGIRRSFGFDMSDGKRPAGLSRATIYHSGWTGQTIAIDPETGFCGVVLTARTGDHGRAIVGRNRILAALAGAKRLSENSK